MHHPNYVDLFTRSLVQVVQLRAIVLQTNQVLAQAEGVGGASLLHVPMTMKVKTEAKEGEEGDEGEQVRQMHHHPLTPLRRSTHNLVSSLFHLCFIFVPYAFKVQHIAPRRRYTITKADGKLVSRDDHGNIGLSVDSDVAASSSRNGRL